MESSPGRRDFRTCLNGCRYCVSFVICARCSTTVCVCSVDTTTMGDQAAQCRGGEPIRCDQVAVGNVGSRLL